MRWGPGVLILLTRYRMVSVLLDLKKGWGQGRIVPYCISVCNVLQLFSIYIIFGLICAQYQSNILLLTERQFFLVKNQCCKTPKKAELNSC